LKYRPRKKKNEIQRSLKLVWASSKAREEGYAFDARIDVERRKRYHC